jgi:2-C-methyl-D-erythritol 4-phosphate cytidylyltransferase
VVDGPVTRVAVVVLAAGSGTRVGGSVNKVLLPVAGIPVVARSVRSARAAAGVRRVLLVVRAGDEDAVRHAVEPGLADDGPEVHMVTGGATRHASEWQALLLLARDIEAGEIDVVVVHDAARPLASPALFDRVVAEAARVGAAIPVAELTTLVHRDGSPVPGHVGGVQTPQAFRARPLLAAHRGAEADGFTAADTAGCLARYTDLPILAVPSTAGNLKVTMAEDLHVADALAQAVGGSLSGG